MNRIESIYSFIDKNDKVVDVGCDQAKLGIMLAKSNIKSIASDISINVILRAKEDINKLGYSNYIDLRVSDGLSNIKEGEADTVVLSGMGTHTILEILNNTKLRFKKVITISNNYHDILRTKMNDLNYKIDRELIIKENNKYYNLILFKEGNNDLTRKEILLGKNHIDDNLYNDYLNYLKNKYLSIKEQSKDRNDKINEVLKYIKFN
ncbi:MAG: class I SAM-dependent methyltransferase [Tenericutes bacterium]|nr:class I SAM-dependent methyltransferase [Mycoplasmatota bacterium]